MCVYLGFDDSLGAGLQDGEVVGENQELELVALQQHLDVVLHCPSLHPHNAMSQRKLVQKNYLVTIPMTTYRTVPERFVIRLLQAIGSSKSMF